MFKSWVLSFSDIFWLWRWCEFTVRRQLPVRQVDSYQ